MKKRKKTLRLVLGDQLNINHSWYRESPDNVIYVMMEMRQETDYVVHHIQKIIGFFLAMRAFAEQLQEKGFEVIYFKINDEENRQKLSENINYLIKKHDIRHFEYQLPDEYRLDEEVKIITDGLSISYEAHDSEHFLSSRNHLAEFFEGKKQYLMESFYRHMRKKYDILMDGKDPEGDQWNYDKLNREKLPEDEDIPAPILFERNVSKLKKEIDNAEIRYFGNIDEKKFIWPVKREEVLDLFQYFLDKGLPRFGKYQDAMTDRSWSLYHSRLSFGLNLKLVSPLEILKKAESHWKNHRKSISIQQIEGFVRQILGWREYMRGIYWAHMPDYAGKNYLIQDRKLPEWYWTGETKMKCLSHSINQSLDFAYAHHIQRLMITGNFGLIAGIHPDELDKWYLGIYIDAIEWVEITNTRGMSQFADGGIVGTKPYASSANYIAKMGDYCQSCHYVKSKKTGNKACPFNSLYWHFYNRHRDKLENNARVGMLYRTWDKMDKAKKKKTLQQAEDYLQNINKL